MLQEKDNRKIPILELSQIRAQRDDKIYVTVEAGRNVVIQNLLDKGFLESQILIAKEEEPKYIEDFFERVYKYYHIKLDSEYFEFNDVRVYNFVRNSKQYENVFRGTIGDEILPGIYQDNTLAVDGPYELYDVNIQEGDVVLDAGANRGLFSCYAASKGAQVIACDPDTRCLEMLKHQQQLYPNRISILPIGLSDSIGEISFFESEDCALSSFSLIRGNTKECTIKTDTIDHLVESGIVPKVDYIKADIEGAERDMLTGAMCTLKVQAPKLSICTYHYHDDPIILENIIRKANPEYKIKHAWRKIYAWVEK